MDGKQFKQVAITAAELSRMISRSTVTLERWRRLRMGPPHFYAVGNRVMYLMADVQAWFASQRERTGRNNGGSVGRWVKRARS